jgi:hypothetical protein
VSPPKSGCPPHVAFEKIAAGVGEHDGPRGRPAGVDLDVPRGVRLYLAGADYVAAGHDDVTAGHLVVIVGFTRGADVIVHDPAAHDPATIRRVYRRGPFEYAWQAGCGGIVYVMHTATVGLPHRSTEANW